MTTEYRNNAFSTITAGLTASAFDVTVSVVSDATFPSVTSPDYFYATLEDTAGQVEILKVTASKVVANQFTVIRGADNTVPLVWAIGSIIEMRLVRAMIEEFRDHNHTATYADLTKTISNSYQFAFRTSSATDSYEASMVVAPPVYVVGLRVQFLSDRANTGACTLDLNSLGVKNIKTQAGDDPADGYIAAISFVDLEYNGVDFILMSPASPDAPTIINSPASGTGVDVTYMSLSPSVVPTSFAVNEFLDDRIRGARINSNGTVFVEVSGITSVKNSTGNYTLTHDIGDLLYVPVVTLHGAVDGVPHVLSYDTTTITITVDNLSGTPVDSAFTVIISAW